MTTVFSEASCTGVRGRSTKQFSHTCL